MASGLGGPGALDRGGVEGRNMAEQQFCLRWNNFQSNIVTSFENLFDKEEFVDVTLTAEGKSLKAHRILLSACSPYFKELFRDLPSHQHPVIVLRDTSFLELKALLSFIYHGEVNVSQDRLGLLLKTAESLRIKGLAQDKRGRDLDHYDGMGVSPEKDMEEYFERERRGAGGPENLILPLRFPPIGGAPGNLLVPVEPPSHKGLMQPASPPLKRRKPMSSPLLRPQGPQSSGHTPPSNHLHSIPGHSTPTHTPPGQMPAVNTTPSMRDAPPPLIQVTPPHATPTSSVSSLITSSEEDGNKVVNLTMSGNGEPSSPAPKVTPKTDTDEEENARSNQDTEGGSNGGGVSTVSPLKKEIHDGPEEQLPIPISQQQPLHNTDDSRCENESMNTANHPPPVMHMPPLPVQTFVPFGSAQLDTYPGPSGVLPSAVCQAGWRGETPTHNTDVTDSSQSGHPVFNELLGGEGVACGGKKAVPTPCPVCSKMLSNAYNMRVHLETHQDTTYKCIICGIITRTRDTMRKHLSNVHKLKNVRLKDSFKKIFGNSSTIGMSSIASPLTASPTGKSHRGGAGSVNKRLNLSASNTPFGFSTAEWPLNFSSGSLPAPDNSESKDFAKGSLASIVSKLSQKQ